MPASVNSVKGLGEGGKDVCPIETFFYDTTGEVKSFIYIYIYIYMYSIGRTFFSKEKGLFYKVDLANAGSQRFCMEWYR